MTARQVLRKDDRAVSQTIAMIAMIGVTVVLAAMLYLMVSSLIPSPPKLKSGMVCGVVQDVQFLPSSYANNGGTQVRISNATYLFDATLNGIVVGQVYTFNYTVQSWDWKVTSYYPGGCAA